MMLFSNDLGKYFCQKLLNLLYVDLMLNVLLKTRHYDHVQGCFTNDTQVACFALEKKYMIFKKLYFYLDSFSG